jgi:Mg/Co/Ni transporter MgtE
VTGLSDWVARGLPREGENSGEPRAVDFAGQDVITCALHDPLGEVRERVEASPYGFAFVVSADDVLLGRLRGTDLEGDPQAAAETVMESGPSTVRADLAPAVLLERLERASLDIAVITDPDGRLLGVVRRENLPNR